jgi:putative redox protein
MGERRADTDREGGRPMTAPTESKPTGGAPAGRPPSRVQVSWAGDRRFDAGRPGGPTLRLDGSGETGQSPVDGVLSALAACTGVDVVDILAKRRTPVESLEMAVTGQRWSGTPGRLTHVRLEYKIAGRGIERVHAERAIELAVTKYCSVRDSLSPEIGIEWTLELNGERDAGHGTRDTTA